jgi:hypothetical protein
MIDEVFHFSVPEFVGEFTPAPEFKVVRNGSLLDLRPAETLTMIENNSIADVEDLMNAGADLKVKVFSKKVLEMVKENRDKHKKDYMEALEGWLEDLKKETARAAREAKKLTVEQALKEGASAVYQDVHVSLPPPRQFLNEYDQVIGTLEICAEEQLELTGRQINAWCHDRWQWKDEFTTSNAAYMCK